MLLRKHCKIVFPAIHLVQRIKAIRTECIHDPAPHIQFILRSDDAKECINSECAIVAPHFRYASRSARSSSSAFVEASASARVAIAVWRRRLVLLVIER